MRACVEYSIDFGEYDDFDRGIECELLLMDPDMTTQSEAINYARRKIQEAENAKPSFLMIAFWLVLFFPVGLLLLGLRMYVSHKISQAYRQLESYK